MIFVILALGVVAIYALVYSLSKQFGKTNDTTILIDSVHDSIKSKRMKVPVELFVKNSFSDLYLNLKVVLVMVAGVLALPFVIFVLGFSGSL